MVLLKKNQDPLVAIKDLESKLLLGAVGELISIFNRKIFMGSAFRSNQELSAKQNKPGSIFSFFSFFFS